MCGCVDVGVLTRAARVVCGVCGDQETGELWRRREEQKRQWLWRLIADELVDRFKQDPNVQQQLGSLEREVARGALPVGIAAERLLDLFGHQHQS